MHEILLRSSTLKVGLIVGLALLAGDSTAPAQPEGHSLPDSVGRLLDGPLSTSNAPAVRVLPLGVFHFNGAPDFNDPMAPTQQREIQAVVDSLLNFRPTKIAVKWPARSQAQLDSLCRAYRAGRHELGANEIEQLGLRIAKKRGHSRLYPIDYKLAWPMDTVET